MKWNVCRAIALACALAACSRREVPVTAPAPEPATPPPAAAPKAAPDKAPEAPKPAASAASTVDSVAITAATLGNAINPDKRVTAAADTFKPGDTIYLSVETSGEAGAALTAKWTFRPQTEATPVNEETQKVPPGGPAVTEFHVRKPDGWPPGDYQVVVRVNGEAPVTQKFSVK